MTYDEDLASRVRELVGGESLLTEQKMFGGLAFLIGGNMAVAASGQGGLLVRVDPSEADKLLATSAAEPMVMRGRSMHGWLRVDSNQLRTKRQLAKWVNLGTSFTAFTTGKGKVAPPLGEGDGVLLRAALQDTLQAGTR